MEQNVKGFIFTIDAAFSLVVAGAAIGILAYVHFAGTPVFQPLTSQAFSVAQSLIETKLVTAADAGSLYAIAAANATLGSASTWQSFDNGGPLSSSSSVGPQLPQLLFTYAASGQISSSVSVGYGMAAFASGDTLYVINATTGSLIMSKSVSGNVLYPIIYNNMIIYGNSTGYVSAVQRSGSASWHSVQLPSAPSTPMSIGGGYIAFGAGANIVLMSPLNGSFSHSSLPNIATVPAYGSGEFVVSTSAPASQNYILGFAVVGGSLQQIWSYKWSVTTSTTPLIAGNLVVVGSANQIVGLSLSGLQLWSITVPGVSAFGGGTLEGGNVYFPMQTNVWQINISCGCKRAGFHIESTLSNSTPSSTAGAFYMLAANDHFLSYRLSNSSSPVWDTELPQSSSAPYQDVALAYGNAYISAGNTVYVFGTCRAVPGGSMLQAIASMYVNGYGGCATSLLNSSYSAPNIGVYINGTYAPSLYLAQFNGINSYVSVPSSASLDSPNTGITISAWVRFNSNAYPYDQAIVNKTNDYALEYVGSNANGCGTAYGLLFLASNFWGCSYEVSFKPAANRWYYITAVWSSVTNEASIYVNASLIGSFQTTGTISFDNNNLGIGNDASGSGLPFNGTISDLQIYDVPLQQRGITSLYDKGIAGVPANSTIAGWWPLLGDTNDYSGNGNIGYPYGVTYTGAKFTPPSLSAAYQVSAAAFPMSLSASANAPLYNVSVVLWR